MVARFEAVKKDKMAEMLEKLATAETLEKLATIMMLEILVLVLIDVGRVPHRQSKTLWERFDASIVDAAHSAGR
jgi:hypothetical protein